MSCDPVNYKKRDRATIRADVDYAFALVASMEHAIRLTGLSISGLRLLELGPGINFGSQLILASKGANITLADRFLARWDPDYHPEFYRQLASACGESHRELDLVIEHGTHSASSLVMLEEAAEDLTSVQSDSIDLVYSNAVLEHIRDVGLVASETFRVTRPGGWGYHQIDWRHHHNFDQPLEHLLLDEEAFIQDAEANNFEGGNRLRSIDFWSAFESAGLSVMERSVNLRAARDYFSATLPRIRAGLSAYRDWPADDLERISGFFLLKKESAGALRLTRERGAAMRALAESLKQASKQFVERELREGSVEIVLDAGKIHHVDGFRWRCMVPMIAAGDSVEHGSRSTLLLYENGVMLAPAHSSHTTISSLGRGRYAHWMQELHFATSDNSSPLENGRTYAIRVRKEEIV